MYEETPAQTHGEAHVIRAVVVVVAVVAVVAATKEIIDQLGRLFSSAQLIID